MSDETGRGGAAGPAAAPARSRGARRRLLIAWALTLPALGWTISAGWSGRAWPSEPVFDAGLAALALAVLLGPGLPVLRRARGAMSSGTADVEVPAAAGSVVAVLTGPAAVLRHLGVPLELGNYAGAGAVIMALHLTARYLEDEVRRRPRSAAAPGASPEPFQARADHSGTPPVVAFAEEPRSASVPVVISAAVAALCGWLVLPELFRGVADRAAFVLPWLDPSAGLPALALGAAVAVLAAACPGVVGAAAETTLSIGEAVGADHGIHVGSRRALETLGGADVVVFDKTGTLTEGRPHVTDVRTTGGVPRTEVLGVAAAVERASDHPLARAVVRAARQIGVRIPGAHGFEADPGRGVRALVDGRVTLVGSERMMEEAGIDVAPILRVARELQGYGRTVVFVALAGRVRGLVALADPLKPSADDALAKLRDLGVEPVMVTGDDGRTAAVVAERAGIRRFRSGLLPDEKRDAVAELREKGRTVAIVAGRAEGSRSLDEGDVELKLGGEPGLEDRRSTAILLRDDLRAVVEAVRLSREIRSRLRGNRLGARIYHAVAVPAAFLGLLHPIVAAAAAFACRGSVVANADRLRTAELGPAREAGGA